MIAEFPETTGGMDTKPTDRFEHPDVTGNTSNLVDVTSTVHIDMKGKGNKRKRSDPSDVPGHSTRGPPVATTSGRLSGVSGEGSLENDEWQVSLTLTLTLTPNLSLTLSLSLTLTLTRGPSCAARL